MTNNADAIRQYLNDAIADEEAFEKQLRAFAAEGDDEEVQLAFSEHADETRMQTERLTSRLTALGANDAKGTSLPASLLDFAPKFAQTGSTIEERLLQNLIAAFSVEKGECAMYEALASVARAAGDELTERLAREIQTEEQAAAERIFHFLPSRSKIVFNVLTPHEIDPAVETKAGIA